MVSEDPVNDRFPELTYSVTKRDYFLLAFWLRCRGLLVPIGLFALPLMSLVFIVDALDNHEGGGEKAA